MRHVYDKNLSIYHNQASLQELHEMNYAKCE